MGQRIAKVLDIDGQFRESPDFPIAVVRNPIENENTGEGRVIDPVFNSSITRNLFGRIMTLVEATTDQHKLKAVKDLFARELGDWESEVYSSAREIADGGNSSSNLYIR